MAGSAGTGHTRILLGLVLGAASGVGLNALAQGFSDFKPILAGLVQYVFKPVGTIFLNLLFFAIIPLVFSSLALGVTKLGGTDNLGRVGIKTVGYFIITTFFAAIIGLTVVNLFKPGNQVPEEQRTELMAEFSQEAGDKLKKKEGTKPFGIETFTNIVPRNPLEAMANKDMLAVIFTSLIVGIALTRIDSERARLLIQALEGVTQITDFVIRLAMSLAPYAVFALIFSATATFGYKLLIALGAFVFTVLAGLSIQLLLVFPLCVWFLGRMSPLDFFRKTRGVMVTAFSTSSSSATLPAALKCAEEELRIPPRISRFVLPLSASMNHNGTALFEGVTVVFLAQVFGVSLSIQEQIIVLILCVLTATGMAGVPGGSLPLIGLILAQVRVPPESIAIVLGVDRILDMCRTMVNITGDMSTVVFVAGTERTEPPAEEPVASESAVAPAAPI